MCLYVYVFVVVVLGTTQDWVRWMNSSLTLSSPPQQLNPDHAATHASLLMLKIAIERADSVHTDDVRRQLLMMDDEVFFGKLNVDQTGKPLAKGYMLLQVVQYDSKLQLYTTQKGTSMHAYMHTCT